MEKGPIESGAIQSEIVPLMTVTDSRGEFTRTKVIGGRSKGKLGGADKHTCLLLVVFGKEHVVGIKILHIGEGFEPGLARNHFQNGVRFGMAGLARDMVTPPR